MRERFSERVKPYYLNVLTVDHASRGRDSGLESQDYLSYIGRMLRGPWKKNEVKIFTSRMHRARHLEILNLIWLEFVHVQVKCSCLWLVSVQNRTEIVELYKLWRLNVLEPAMNDGWNTCNTAKCYKKK